MFKLLMDKSYDGGKAVFYERLLPFLNGMPVMANVDPEDCDWAAVHPEEGGDSPGELLLEAIKHVTRLAGLNHAEAKYVGLMLRYKICR